MIILLTPSHKPRGHLKVFSRKKKKTPSHKQDILTKKIKLTLTLSVREQILQHYIHQQKRKPTEGALGPPSLSLMAALHPASRGLQAG
jgi:hypothetical protein